MGMTRNSFIGKREGFSHIAVAIRYVKFVSSVYNNAKFSPEAAIYAKEFFCFFQIVGVLETTSHLSLLKCIIFAMEVRELDFGEC